MKVQPDEPRSAADRWSDRLAELAYVIRLSRSVDAEPVSPVAVEPVEETDADNTMFPRAPRYAVDLVPGSHRIVTAVIDADASNISFRIPSFWSDIEQALSVSDVSA